MGAARKLRSQQVAEDAAESGVVFAFFPEDEEEWRTPMEDAMAHTVDASETWPRFYCESCGTHNEGRWLNCAMCGEWREDVDLCV